jgi:hypothetical protein
MSLKLKTLKPAGSDTDLLGTCLKPARKTGKISPENLDPAKITPSLKLLGRTPEAETNTALALHRDERQVTRKASHPAMGDGLQMSHKRQARME